MRMPFRIGVVVVLLFVGFSHSSRAAEVTFDFTATLNELQSSSSVSFLQPHQTFPSLTIIGSFDSDVIPAVTDPIDAINQAWQANNASVSGAFRYNTTSPNLPPELTGGALVHPGSFITVEMKDLANQSATATAVVPDVDAVVFGFGVAIIGSGPIDSPTPVFTGGATFDVASPLTTTVDLNDASFFDGAPRPVMSSMPVRLTHPNQLQLEFAELDFLDGPNTDRPDDILPLEIVLDDLSDATLVMHWGGQMQIDVVASDYANSADFQAASDWVAQEIERVDIIADSSMTVTQLSSVITPGTAPEVPLLPIQTDPDGTFVFEDQPVDAETAVWYDPVVAVGYEYEVTSGPGVTQVLIQEIDGQTSFLISSDGLFSELVIEADVPFDITPFDADGVETFTITGIDLAAGLDPDDPTAFVTGLVFAADGTASVTMKPITNDIPEPSAALCLAFVGGMLCMRDRRQMYSGK